MSVGRMLTLIHYGCGVTLAGLLVEMHLLRSVSGEAVSAGLNCLVHDSNQGSLCGCKYPNGTIYQDDMGQDVGPGAGREEWNSDYFSS